jgi:predicted Zn-dependent protease
MFVGPEPALHTRSDDELACVMGHELAHFTEGSHFRSVGERRVSAGGARWWEQRRG